MIAAPLSALVGAALGAGVLLVAAPWLWPRTAREQSGEARPPAQTSSRLAARLRDLILQAGYPRLRPDVFVVLSGALGVLVGGAAAALTSIPALAVVAGTSSAAAPAVLLTARAGRRQREAQLAWPDLVEHVIASLRAGVPLSAAIGGLSAVASPSLRPGFGEFERMLRAKGSLDDALEALTTELADPVADRVIASVRVAREVGGTELTGILKSLATALRREAAARGEAEARQSWVIAAARLGVSAPWAVILVLATRPETHAVYASPGGTLLILLGFGVTLVAYVLMLRVGRLPRERRWLAA